MPFDINSFLTVIESVLTARHLGLILTQCSTLWLFDIMQPTLTQLCNITLHCGHYILVNILKLEQKYIIVTIFKHMTQHSD